MSIDFFIAPLIQQNARKANGAYRWTVKTAREGCVWTSLTNAIANAVGKVLSPDTVHAQVKLSEEVNPKTPGWHLDDAALAARRLGYGFVNRSGSGFAQMRQASDNGFMVLLQGDSDQFSDDTCSGVFDGLHCIAVHPERNVAGEPLIYDPICKRFRYESWATLKRYADKLSVRTFWGQLMDQVARVDGLRLYPGARKTVPYPDRVRLADDHVNVHSKPQAGASTVIRTIVGKTGQLWTPSQRIQVAGAWWYGNKLGTRWIEDSQLTHEGRVDMTRSVAKGDRT